MDYNSELPLGFGMALAMNESAMGHYVKLTEAEKEKLLAHTRNVKSREEMDRIVQCLAENDTWDSAQLNDMLGADGVVQGPSIG